MLKKIKYLDEYFFDKIPCEYEENIDFIKMEPKVSVLVICYNQKKYINDTIQGILNQRTSFEYEIIIGDDHSTDGTLDVVKEYEHRFPKKIQIVSAKINIGFIKNYLRIYNRCRGKYIAICEGDDYWIDDLKLQKQFDALELRNDASMCFTNIKVLKDNHFTEKGSIAGVFSIRDLINGLYMPTCSLFFRKYSIKIPETILELSFLDRALILLQMLNGPAIRIFDCTSVYRIHSEGVWSPKSKKERITGMIKFYRFAQKITKYKIEFEMNIMYSYIKYIYYSVL